MSCLFRLPYSSDLHTYTLPSHTSCFSFLGIIRRDGTSGAPRGCQEKCLNVLSLADAEVHPVFPHENSFFGLFSRSLRFVKPDYTADNPPVSLQVNCPLFILVLGAVSVRQDVLRCSGNVISALFFHYVNLACKGLTTNCKRN